MAAAILAAGWVWAGDGIPLKTRTVPLDGLAASGERVKRRAGSRSHWLLEFPGTPGAAEAAALAARGVVVTSRVSGRVLAVSAADGIDVGALGAERAGRLAAADKISPLLAEEAPSAFLVEFHADVLPEDAQALVREAGFALLEHPDLLPNQLLVAGGPESAAALAEWDEVAYVFPAAPELVAGERMAACSGALTEQGLVAQYVRVGEGWGAGPLRYFFESLTTRLDRSTVESEVVRALAEWSRYARLEFTPAAGAAASRTIAILFARGAHGDGMPFDGAGKVLAHTYYPAPPNREPLAGDMHLDDDEAWHVGAPVDLFTVALHEAGHALGLGHVDRPGSVMYPYYRQAAGLADDDIAGIRALYGSRETAPPPVTPPQPPEPPAPQAMTLTVLQPSGATATTSAGAIAFSGRVDNAAGSVQVEWRSDRGPSGAAAGSAEWSVAAVPLSVGANVVTVTATGAGASVSRSVTVTRQAQPATGGAAGTPPGLKITSPSLTIVSTSLAAITLRGTASADAVSVSWSNSTGPSGGASGTAAWVAADIPLCKGTNSIKVRAFAAGGASSWRSVTVVRR